MPRFRRPVRRCVRAAALLVGLGGPHLVQADNGAVAVARPLEGIRIDGRLDDWPDQVPALPLRWTAYGRQLRDAEDLAATLRIAVEAGGQALLAAVDVTDESVIVDGPAGWDTRDGAEVFVAWQPDGTVQQFVLYGTVAGSADADVAVRTAPRRRTYEWRLPAPRAIRPGTVVGFDASVCDLDADGSFSWQTWGRGEQKTSLPGRLGDLLILDADQPLHSLTGRLRDRAGAPAPAALVDVASGPLLITVRTGADGRFDALLPAGPALVRPRFEPGDSARVEVPSSADVQLTLSGPPQGRSTTVQPRRVAAGAGQVDGSWTVWSLLDGLPVGAVGDLRLEGAHALWLASQSGLVRFDGARFEILDEASGLPRRGVQVLHRDRRGALWLGTGRHNAPGAGVARLEDGLLTVFDVGQGLAHGSVMSILEDRQGHLWFGTFGGLTRFDGERFRTYTVEDGLGDNIVMALAEDGDGVLWAGTGYARTRGIPGGLSRFDGDRFTTFTTDDGLPSNWVSDLHVDGDRMWIATLGGGVACFDGRSFTVLDVADGLPSQRVWDIEALADGTLAIATSRGLAFYDGRGLTPASAVDAFAGVDVYALQATGDGRLWMSSALGALGRLDRDQLLVLDPDDGHSPVEVSWIDAGRDGDLWLVDRLGLYRVSRDGLRRIEVPDQVPTSYQVLNDSQGRLWIGTQAGASYLDDGTWTHLTPADGLVAPAVTHLYEDAAGRIWLGTRGGVSVWEGGRLRSFAAFGNQPSPRVLSMADDGHGGVLIGSTTGLGRWRPGEPGISVLLTGHATPLLTDDGGRAWITRAAGGVTILDGGRRDSLTTEIGLPHSVAVAALGRDGSVWLGSLEGVARWNGTAVQTFRDAGDPGVPIASICRVDDEMWFGTRGRGVLRYDGELFQSLTTQDGLAGNTVYDMAVDASGFVWLVTDGGLTRYRRQPGVPRIQLDDVVVDRPLGARHLLRMPSSQDYVGFFFTGSSLTNRPAALSYRYRLLPHETAWRTSRDGSVSFGDLPRGEYAFEAFAVDRDFGRSEPLRVTIDVHLPYERIAWVGALVLSAGLVTLQARRLWQRDRRLRATNEQLRAANQDLSSEMQRREQAEAERAALGLQVRELRYLNRLREVLDGASSTEELLAAAGAALVEVVPTAGGARVDLSCDGRTWSWSSPEEGGPNAYEVPLEWGDSARGRLRLECGVPLDEGQRRALLDETAAQLARRLENQELTVQLLQSARLVSLGEMAAGVAHELNQPLAAISMTMGDVRMRQRRGRTVKPEEIGEIADDILGLVERMSRTITHLRTFSRDASIEPGSPVDVGDVVRSCLTVIGAQLRNHEIDVALDLDDGLPVIQGNAHQLEQVLLNLLANARDALDERAGRESGHLKRLAIRSRHVPAARSVEVSVEDNGAGIEAEHLARLYEPFFSTKPASEGTGLGLSISYAIARNHGGLLSCESRPGAGTTFRLRLPAESQAG